MNGAANLAPDAAMVLGIASTALPFARTPEAEAERWLRVLYMHGEVGIVLHALGVGEGPLREPLEGANRERSAPAGAGDRERGAPAGVGDHGQGAPAGAGDRDAVALVIEQAIHIAGRRGAARVATTDLLLAVMRVYGAAFDRVLQAHGANRDEVIERLGAGTSAPGEGRGRPAPAPGEG